jgi:hypothetical protein
MGGHFSSAGAAAAADDAAASQPNHLRREAAPGPTAALVRGDGQRPSKHAWKVAR